MQKGEDHKCGCFMKIWEYVAFLVGLRECKTFRIGDI
jgi:hypothetical protein